MTGVFYVPLGDAGVERTPNKSQHTKLTLEKKILPPLLPGFELATFRSRVWRSNQQAIPAHNRANRVHTQKFCRTQYRMPYPYGSVQTDSRLNPVIDSGPYEFDQRAAFCAETI